MPPHEGILLLDKPKGITSFRLVQILRKRFGVKKIGHAGTLDPFATGVMVMLIGRNFTRQSNQFLACEKEYVAELFLGKATDTYDVEGTVTQESTYIPSEEEVKSALTSFQGEVMQVPPMYSAKKVQGTRLYKMARQGQEIEREAVKVCLNTTLVRYAYPLLELRIVCSKGTYIRSIAHELGQKLGCFAYLQNLRRVRSGTFTIDQCITLEALAHSHCIVKN